jgi:predicted SprT family Zn-dependent metalloprotease
MVKRRPDNAALDRLFDKFNRKYWNGKLPKHIVRWSNRLKLAANVNYRIKEIHVGAKYYEHYPDDLEGAIKHEMVHIALGPKSGHRKRFIDEAERVGGVLMHSKSYPGSRKVRPFRYVYECPECGKRRFYKNEGSYYCDWCRKVHGKGSPEMTPELYLYRTIDRDRIDYSSPDWGEMTWEIKNDLLGFLAQWPERLHPLEELADTMGHDIECLRKVIENHWSELDTKDPTLIIHGLIDDKKKVIAMLGTRDEKLGKMHFGEEGYKRILKRHERD